MSERPTPKLGLPGMKKMSDLSSTVPEKSLEESRDVSGPRTVNGLMELSLVIDKDTGLPLCVILQAIYNPSGHSMPHFIPAEVWQLDPPKTPMLVTGTRTQWESVVPRMIEKAKARKTPGGVLIWFFEGFGCETGGIDRRRGGAA